MLRSDLSESTKGFLAVKNVTILSVSSLSFSPWHEMLLRVVHVWYVVPVKSCIDWLI